MSVEQLRPSKRVNIEHKRDQNYYIGTYSDALLKDTAHHGAKVGTSSSLKNQNDFRSAIVGLPGSGTSRPVPERQFQAEPKASRNTFTSIEVGEKPPKARAAITYDRGMAPPTRQGRYNY